MPKPSPSHTFKKNGIYYLRLAIPLDLRPLVGKCELRYSLKTGYRSEAAARAGYVTNHIRSLLSLLRGIHLPKLTNSLIRTLVEEYVRARLDEFSHANEARMNNEILKAMGIERQGPIDRSFEKMLRELRKIHDEREKFENISLIARSKEFLEQKGFKDFLDSPAFSAFCVGTSTAEKKFFLYFLAILNEERNPEDRLNELLDVDSYHPRLPGSLQRPVHLPPQLASKQDHNLVSIPLSQLIEKYTIERKQTWKDSTAQEYPGILSEFLEITGDIDSAALTKAHLVHYKDTLLKLPAGRGRKAQFKGKSIKEILEMGYANTVTAQTANKHLLVIAGLLNWATGSGYCASNFAKGLQIRLPKGNPRDARSIWTKEDLKILFAEDTYPLSGQAHMFWLPILGLLTGARIDELSQLSPDDIRITDGIWCLHIDDTNGKRIKTPFSKRVVPLHPFLVDTLYLHEYARKIKDTGESRIFPELFQYRSDCRKIASKNFSKFIRRKLKITDTRLSFHSFRHTVKQYLVNAGVEKMMRNDLMGWQNDNVSDGVYGVQTPPRILYEQAVKKIPLEHDYSFLAKAPWVIPSKPKGKKSPPA